MYQDELDAFFGRRGVPFDPTDAARGRVWRCADCGHLVASDVPILNPAPCSVCQSIFFEKKSAPLQ